ncbi:hypothetical protein FHU40_002909 [Nocardioides soli]|uniref:Uncharacterized protein n=1 Tax=Nocardioides soli TaxID=1036020 RepID=A0A7W4VWH1_9ACTN|nr:hypothetical protein [Nocardioides soli]
MAVVFVVNSRKGATVLSETSVLITAVV